MKEINLNNSPEPEVLPVEPEVVPETTPEKPRPSEDDPFAVPGPKVNPTPKGIKEEVDMTKVRINKVDDFKVLFKKNPNIAQFKMDNMVDDDILTKVLADSVNMTLEVTDKSPGIMKGFIELDNFQKV